MPDTLTHFSIAYLAGHSKRMRKSLPVLLAGTVLPDVLGRAPERFVPERLVHGSYWILAPFHSPAVLAAVCFLISLLFSEKSRKKVFTYLFLGAALHVLLDHFQVQFGSRRYYYPFFPFSFWNFQVPLFRHVDDSMYLVPFLVFLMILIRQVEKNEQPGSSKQP